MINKSTLGQPPNGLNVPRAQCMFLREKFSPLSYPIVVDSTGQELIMVEIPSKMDAM
jgi:hypothetical protein